MKNESLKRLIKEEIKNILENSEEKINTGQKKISGGDFNNAGQEKISAGNFNLQLIAFVRDLKKEQSKIMDTEKQNLLDLFNLLVQKAKEGTLNQSIEDKIKKILMLKDPETPEI
jgi:hypothetical protein